MKLSKLYLIAVLAGTVAVIGCTTDSGNGDGTGGTGGVEPADPCTGGLCETLDVETDCDAARAACKLDVEFDLTDAQCDAMATEFYCNVGDPGTGGAGGDGAGGASGVQGCDVDLCLSNADRKTACEEFMPKCTEFCEGEGSAEACGVDECVGFAALFICNEFVL